MTSPEAMKELRKHRNIRLKSTDWWDVSDQPAMTDAQKKYRQDLRDLPETAEPEMDSNFIISNVTWPENPKEAE